MVWLSKTKKWEKSKILLYGYRKFHCIPKRKDIYDDHVEDVETRSDTSNYELDRVKNKKKLKIKKREKSKGTKKCVIKIKPKFDNYKKKQLSLLERNEITIDSLKKDHKEFIKKKKYIKMTIKI